MRLIIKEFIESAEVEDMLFPHNKEEIGLLNEGLEVRLVHKLKGWYYIGAV